MFIFIQSIYTDTINRKEGANNMNKQSILNDVKTELTKRIAEISFENFEQVEQDTLKLFAYVRLTKELPITDTAIENDSLINNEDNTNNSNLAEVDYNTINAQDENESEIGNRYEFQRKLSGGVIEGLGPDGCYMIPEKMVHDMGVNHLDIVEVIDENIFEGRPTYRFKIVEERNAVLESRGEYKYCKVRRDPETDECTISSTYNEDIIINGAPFTFVINDHIASRWKLENETIVDIAYYKDNPQESVHITRKYALHETYRPTLEQKKLNFTSEKQNEEQEYPPEKPAVVDKTLFEGKKVLIVGSYTRRIEIKEALESVGVARVEHASGDEAKVRLRNMVKRQDIVVISTKELGHKGAGSEYTVEVCKELKIPFDTTHENGPQRILLSAEQAFLKGQQKDKKSEDMVS